MRKNVIFSLVFVLMSLISLVTYGLPNLSVPALECYKQAVNLDKLFTMNKMYKSDMEIEKMAIGLCTYSDAEGSLRCYQQAQNDSAVLTQAKNFDSIFLLEKKYSRLCSNSGKNLINQKTGDADSIECFKEVVSNSQLLVAAKQFMTVVELEDLTTKLCISSNALGVKQCYFKSLGNSDLILEANKKYVGAAALDQLIVDLCMGSRLR